MSTRKITIIAGLLMGTLALASCSSTPSSQGSGSNRTTTVPSTSAASTTTVPTTTSTTTASTTTPSTTTTATPAGYTSAKQAWQSGATADSADQAMYWAQAASDLGSVSPGNGADKEAIAELQQLETIPETSDTPAQITEAENDTTALNTFFGTPGLYG